MMIFGKAIPRRKFLRGMGAAVALPLLDAMVPAMGRSEETKAPLRLGYVYVPNGIIMDQWTPKMDGASYELSPILQPLSAFRDRFVVISGLTNDGPAQLLPGETPGPHSTAASTYMTCVHPKKTSGADLHAGTSVDQIVAKEFGKNTQIASLELSLEPSDFLGACEFGWNCAYLNTISWRTETTPMPVENNPRVVFERLFGSSYNTDPAERLARIRMRRSILDIVAGEVGTLEPELGPSDKVKLNEYLDAVRDLERRIQKAEEQASQEAPRLDRPAGIPATFEEHAKIMFDLQVLAYQTDLTRVITFMIGRETSPRPYTEIGISDQHHPLTHHSGDTEKIAKVIRINTYHTKTMGYYLEKLRSTPDGEGSLLDHLLIVYGGGISDGNLHAKTDLPCLVFGGAGKIKGGRHIRFPQNQTPVANMHFTLMDQLGIHVDKFGNSTGKLDLLSI